MGKKIAKNVKNRNENPEYIEHFGNLFLIFGKWKIFGEIFGNVFGKSRLTESGKETVMRKRNYKGRCIKKSVSKSKEVCKLFDEIQCKYLDLMQDNPDVAEIICNVPLDDEELGEYSTDFLCVLSNGDRFVRECVYRKLLTKPKTANLLDQSRIYWLRRGITDWGIVVDAEK